MAVDPELVLLEEEEEEVHEPEVENHDPPAHNPYAPPDEVCKVYFWILQRTRCTSFDYKYGYHFDLFFFQLLIFFFSGW